MTGMSAVSWWLSGILGVLSAAPTAVAAPPARQVLPTEFSHGRIYVVPRLAGSGEVLRLYTDSGGGLNMVPQDQVELRNLVVGEPVRGDGGMVYSTVHWPDFVDGAGIPQPLADPFLKGRLASVPLDALRKQGIFEGMLGNRWFGARIWEFDYPARTLAVLARVDACQACAHTPMTTLADKGMHFARIEVEIDGERLPVLFDTGATFTLGADAAPLWKLAQGTGVAGSFIVARQFDQWQRRHPDWQVVDDGDVLPGGRAMAMIQVPDVRIAGVSAGPAWFSRRADTNFDDMMSSLTDAPVIGAIGGSAFSRLRLIADYPAQRLYVERGKAPRP